MLNLRILKFKSGLLLYCLVQNKRINYLWIPYKPQSLFNLSFFQKLFFGNLLGFKKWLYINGFGFRTSLQKNFGLKKLGFKIGFSHNIFYRLPSNVGLKRFTAVLKGVGKFKYGKIKVILFKTNSFKILELLLNILKKIRCINSYKLKGLYFKNQIYLLKKIKKKTKTRN
jgi:hypothetical protein